MSQITKPMALDETLQDVVTAIQGITQGGMIVSTGNVGSATQPVYIDGGVPTEGNSIITSDTEWKSDFNAIPNASGFYLMTKASGDILNTPYGSQAGGIWHVMQEATGSSSYPRTTQITTRVNSGDGRGELWTRTKMDSSWSSWNRIGGGITTGTPTSANSNISLDRTEVYKSGNVVQVNVRAIVNTAFTPTETTVLVTLPYKAKGTWQQIARLSGTMDGSNSTGRCEISNTGQIVWGSAPYSQLAANTKIWFSGTYLTND